VGWTVKQYVQPKEFSILSYRSMGVQQIAKSILRKRQSRVIAGIRDSSLVVVRLVMRWIFGQFYGVRNKQGCLTQHRCCNQHEYKEYCYFLTLGLVSKVGIWVHHVYSYGITTAASLASSDREFSSAASRGTLQTRINSSTASHTPTTAKPISRYNRAFTLAVSSTSPSSIALICNAKILE
jgi:hypothetical protein